MGEWLTAGAGGTLEPVLATPIRREEFLLGKALAAFVPSLAISYAVLAFFLACVELFAHPGIASALLRAPDLLAQLLFTQLLAAWSIWVGIAISARSSDVRVAGQLSLLASLPSVAVTTLIALNVIRPPLGLALGGAAVLLVLDGLGWRITSTDSAANVSSPAPAEGMRSPRPGAGPGRLISAMTAMFA